MAIRDDFTAGEVLAAADLNDTFASKVPFSYGTATPTTTVEGFIWFDEATTPPTAKVWDGSAFVTFSGAGNADFGDAATGTYSSGGVNYKYKTYTGSGTVTITKAGIADILVVGAGGGSGFNTPGAGGGSRENLYQLTATTYTITVGAGGSAGVSIGNTSSFGSLVSCKGGQTYPSALGVGGPGLGGIASGNGGTGGGGAGGNASGATGGVGIASLLTNTSVTRGAGGTYNGNAAGGANTGNGASSAPSTDLAGGSGVVIIRVRTN